MSDEEKKKKLEALKGLLKEFRVNLDAYDTPDLGGIEKGILQNTCSHLNKIQINLFALSDQAFKKEMEKGVGVSVESSPRHL
jgi:hypothetical protein